jgi:hypothetical protein
MYLRESRWPTPFKQFRADFSVILGAVKAQNPACTLVLVPIRALVLDAEFDKVKARLLASGYREDEIDRYAINRFIERLCRERGIGFIDLTPVYTQHADPITLFLAGDNHPSPAGTRVCAQTICDAMSRGSRH